MKKGFVWSLCLMIIFTLSSCCVRGKKVIRDVSEISPDVVEVIPMIEARGYLKVGEEYRYKVGWLGLDVGSAFLTIEDKSVTDGKEVYGVRLEAVTNKFFSVFYKVTGDVKSYIDTKTFKPVKHDSFTKINAKEIFKNILYDFDANIAYSEDRKGKYEVPIFEDTLDPLGVFYYFTLNPFKFKEPIRLNINGGKKNFSVTVIASKKRRIRVPAGRFDAFLVEPTVDSERQFDDVLKAQGRMRIWFSADERRIPLMITLKIPVGTAKAVLTSITTVEPVIKEIITSIKSAENDTL